MNKHKQNHNVMHKKQFYEAPEAEMLMVRFEGNFCTTGYTPGGGGSYGEGDENDNGEY